MEPVLFLTFTLNTDSVTSLVGSLKKVVNTTTSIDPEERTSLVPALCCEPVNELED